MPASITKAYEEEISRLLDEKIVRDGMENVEVKTQWPPFKGFYGRSIYSPAVDVAVGPFALDRRYIQEYDLLAQMNSRLIKKLISRFKENIQEFSAVNSPPFPMNVENITEGNFGCNAANKNARCFIAIEVENRGSKKHTLGDLVNASSLGRIGIVIPYNEACYRTFFRLLYYFNFLKSVNKPSYSTHNLLIIKKDQFKDVLNSLSNRP